MDRRSTTQPRALPRSDWYPDPAGIGELRYWNGWAWTSGVVIRGQVVERPLLHPPSGPLRETMPEFPLRAGLMGLGGFAIGLLAAAGLALGADAVDLPRIVRLLVSQAALWGALLGTCLLVSRRYASGRLAQDFGLSLRPSDLSWGLLMSVLARVAGFIALIPFLLGSKRLLQGAGQPYEDLLGDPATLIAFAVLAILGAPLVEELFFRGLLQGSMVRSVGTAGAIAIQAVLFGLAHFDPTLGVRSFAVVAAITAAGVVFGIAAWWRRLGTSVMAHMFFNMIAVLFLVGRELGSG